MARSLISLLLTALLLGVSSCSTPPKYPPTAQGNEAEPGPVTYQQNLETIVLLGTNDIHGALAPVDLKTREPSGTEAISYKAGGLTYFASYLKALRRDVGDRLVWLDAGDEYQGTLESNPNHGKAMVAALSSLGLTAAAVGNHEFDFGAEAPDTQDRLSALKHRMSEARFPYLAANIYDAKSGELEKFPNTLPSMIVDAGRVKLGIIGLSTRDTPHTTRPQNVESLRFGDLREATLREAKELRKSGADVVVITAHAGLFCEPGHSPSSHILRKATDSQGSCGANDEMVQLLKGLPTGTVDAVVSGHTHSVVHHWINGVPVIEGGASGRYFNLIYLTYDTDKHRLVPDLTRIEGPVPVCPKVFQNQGDCNGDRPAPRSAPTEAKADAKAGGTTNAAASASAEAAPATGPNHGRGALVTPIFHRERIVEDSDTAALLKPVFDEANRTKSEVFGQAARPIEHLRKEESPLGDLVADAIRVAGHADVALANSGGIRTSIEQGPITYGEIFRAVPFDNEVVTLTLSGQELRTLLAIAESGSRGFPPVSGLSLRLIHPESDAPSHDLNGDKKIEPWEIDRLLEVKMADGSPLDDRKQYRLATLDYLAGGGDDYGWFMGQIPEARRQDDGVFVRDAVASYFRDMSAKQGGLNSVEHPAIDAAHPRFVFEKIKAKPEKGRRGRRHRRRRRRHG